MKEAHIEVPARDGFPLSVTFFEPSQDCGVVVVMHSATAVPRKIYTPFARAMAQRGAAVVTYDYRGIGESRPKSLKGFPARMRDWARFDAPGVVDAALENWPGRKLYGVGHSYGGHAMGLMPDNQRQERIAMVAAQSGYWRLIAKRDQPRVWTLLNILGPASVNLLGYVPGEHLGLGQDLPRGVFEEWRRWCMTPDYFFSDPTLDLLANFQNVTAPVLAVGMSDDDWATPRAIDAFVRGFTATKIERLTLTPEQAGVRKVGHLDFFRAQFATTLWPTVIDWLLGRAATEGSL